MTLNKMHFLRQDKTNNPTRKRYPNPDPLLTECYNIILELGVMAQKIENEGVVEQLCTKIEDAHEKILEMMWERNGSPLAGEEE